jgi:hypothetical protein
MNKQLINSSVESMLHINILAKSSCVIVLRCISNVLKGIKQTTRFTSQNISFIVADQENYREETTSVRQRSNGTYNRILAYSS